MFEYIKLQRTMCFGTCLVYSVQTLDTLIRYIVISASKKEAIYLAEKECSRQEALKWEVQQIGFDIDDYYEPLILMRDVMYSQNTKKLNYT